MRDKIIIVPNCVPFRKIHVERRNMTFAKWDMTFVDLIRIKSKLNSYSEEYSVFYFTFD